MLGEWDVDGLLAVIPPHAMDEWQAFYTLKPWDAAATAALAEGQFEWPDWLWDLVDRQAALDKKRTPAKKRGMTKAAILRRLHSKGKGSPIGWLWP